MAPPFLILIVGIMGREELKKLGFSKCIVPESNKRGLTVPDGLTVYYAKNVVSALQFLF